MSKRWPKNVKQRVSRLMPGVSPTSKKMMMRKKMMFKADVHNLTET